MVRFERLHSLLRGLFVLIFLEFCIAIVLRGYALSRARASGTLEPVDIIAMIGMLAFPPMIYALFRIRTMQQDLLAHADTDRRSREEAEATLGAISEGVYGLDRDGRCAMVNDSACEMLGYRADELIGRRLHDVIHHTHPDGSPYPVADCPMYHAMAEGRRRTSEDEVLWRKDGTSFPVAYTSSPIMHDGDAIGAVVSFTDITERRAMEHALRESDKRVLSFLDLLPVGVFVIDAAGRFVYSNEASTALLGRPPDPEVVGEELSQDYQLVVAGTDDPYPPDKLPILRALAGETVDADDIEVVQLDGTRIPVEVWASPMRDERGRIVYASAVFTDIQARKEIESALRTAMQEAESANRAKSEFLSRMSHELRTPLNSILGFAQVLQTDEALGQEQKDGVGEISRAARHLLDLINEILDLARIEAGKLSVSVEPVSLDVVVVECMSLIKPLADQRQINLRLDRGGDGDGDLRELYVQGDRQRLKQVLLNLLSNAVKYNRPGGEVRVGYGVAARKIEVFVADTGRGIPPDKMERLFEPFDRLGIADENEEGTGLGLALARSLVGLMKGELTVTSEPGRGSRFSVRLTRAVPPTESGSESRAPTDPSARSMKVEGVVLYIEDNFANIKLVETIFKRRPLVTLHTVMLGQLGIDLALQKQPDLILLDVNLPDLSGDEVLLRLQLDPMTDSIPVVMLSADASGSQMKRMLEAGATAYITKPLDLIGFFEVVDSILTGTNSTGTDLTAPDNLQAQEEGADRD